MVIGKNVCFQADRPVLMMGEQDVVNVIEGQSFNLSCLVSVPANIDSKVNCMKIFIFMRHLFDHPLSTTSALN